MTDPFRKSLDSEALAALVAEVDFQDAAARLRAEVERVNDPALTEACDYFGRMLEGYGKL